jgi:hypothetical protein
MMRAVTELVLVELLRQEKGKGKAAAEKIEAHVPSPSSSSQEWLYLILRDMVSR